MTTTAPKLPPTARRAGKRRRSTPSKWSEPAEVGAGLLIRVSREVGMDRHPAVEVLREGEREDFRRW
jgi:hypothetical protein